MRSISLLPLLLLARITVPLSADNPPDRLTLDSLYVAALKRSAVIAEHRELLFQAEEKLAQAWAGVMPTISTSFSYYRADNATAPTVAADQLAWKFNLNQPVFRGFRALLAIQQAGQTIKAQKEARQWAAQLLFSDCAAGFWGVRVLENDLALIDTQIGLYDRRIKDLEGRFKIGRSRQSEVLGVQVTRAQLAAQREQVAGQLETARQLLVFLGGGAPDQVLSEGAATVNPLPPRHESLTAVSARPDIRAARERVLAAETGRLAALGAHLPSIDAGADLFPLRSGVSGAGSVWDAYVSASLPLFAGGLYLARDREARSLALQAAEALRGVTLRAEQEIAAAWSTAAFDERQIRALEEALKLAEVSWRSQETEFNLGLTTSIEVLGAMVAFHDTRRTLDRARYAARVDRARLSVSTAAVTVPDWFLEPPRPSFCPLADTAR